MEKQITTSGEFCACPDTRKHEYITRMNGVETNKNPVPDFCGSCQKPIAKEILLIDFVPAKKPDWMSDEQYAVISRH